MKTLLTTLTIALAFSASPIAFAQETDDSQENNKNITEQNGPHRFWDITIPGGSYIVALDRIAAISKHSYLLSGAIVHEVSIETTGSALVRFYAMEPIGADNPAGSIINRGSELIDRQGQNAGIKATTTVTKEYPITTHAKTIEFRLSKQEDLNALYASIVRAWRENRGRRLIIK